MKLKRPDSSDPPPAGTAGQVLRECGLVLKPVEKSGGNFHSICCDQAIFAKQLDRKMKYAVNHPMNIEWFLRDFIAYLESDSDKSDQEKDEVLVKALQPTRTSAEGLETARGPTQESVIRLLLQTADLQPKLTTWLLEKLALISIEEEDRPLARTTSKDGSGMNKPQLVLSQLRWLDRVVDGEALTDKLLEILDATSSQVTLEVIASLPEIVAESSHHEKIAMALRDKLARQQLLGGDGPMTNVILDTLDNLSIRYVKIYSTQANNWPCKAE